MQPVSRDANRERSLRDFREGLTRLESRPRFLVVELTQGCNLQCPMCRPALIPVSARRMSDAHFERIAGELFDTAEMIDLRGWGESLILPDIEQRIGDAARHGARVRLVTNLAFHRPAIIDVLAEHGCEVCVSVDTADPHLFRELRGGADLERVGRNLSALSDAYRRRSSTGGLYINATVQRPALDSLHELVDFVADRGITQIRFSGVSIPPGHPLSLDDVADRVDAALDRCRERARVRGVTVRANTRLGSMPTHPPGMPACIHPWVYAYFAWDGHVGFCDHLIGDEGVPYLLGHLDESSFEEIWNGEKWQELRREHLTTRNEHAAYFHECAWCYRNRNTEFDDHFVPETAAGIRYL